MSNILFRCSANVSFSPAIEKLLILEKVTDGTATLSIKSLPGIKILLKRRLDVNSNKLLLSLNRPSNIIIEKAGSAIVIHISDQETHSLPVYRLEANSLIKSKHKTRKHLFFHGETDDLSPKPYLSLHRYL